MKVSNNASSPATDASEQAEPTERSYATVQQLEFDPLKDLNLPSSYQEVVARLNKLQGERVMEVLN